VGKHKDFLLNRVSIEGARRRPLFVLEANGDVRPGFGDVSPCYKSTNATDVRIGCLRRQAERLRPSHCLRTSHSNPNFNPISYPTSSKTTTHQAIRQSPPQNTSPSALRCTGLPSKHRGHPTTHISTQPRSMKRFCTSGPQLSEQNVKSRTKPFRS
jgi:hypothetical protein